MVKDTVVADVEGATHVTKLRIPHMRQCETHWQALRPAIGELERRAEAADRRLYAKLGHRRAKVATAQRDASAWFKDNVSAQGAARRTRLLSVPPAVKILACGVIERMTGAS